MSGECGTPSMLDAPDPEEPCCWGAVMGGACTCWTEILDIDPDPAAVQEGPNPVQPSRCGDCAYRRDSPEQADDTPLPYSAEHPFWCHSPREGKTAGLPIVVGYRHAETGEVREAPHGDSYQPIQRNDRVWNADGSPAPLCAGWAQRAGVKP